MDEIHLINGTWFEITGINRCELISLSSITHIGYKNTKDNYFIEVFFLAYDQITVISIADNEKFDNFNKLKYWVAGIK